MRMITESSGWITIQWVTSLTPSAAAWARRGKLTPIIIPPPRAAEVTMNWRRP